MMVTISELSLYQASMGGHGVTLPDQRSWVQHHDAIEHGMETECVSAAASATLLLVLLLLYCCWQSH